MKELEVILVVDDDENVRNGIAHYLGGLEKEKYYVIKAGSGHQGLELATERKPDLIITDQDMPEVSGLGMSGVEMIGQIHDSLGTIPPTIFVSGLDSGELQRRIRDRIPGIQDKTMPITLMKPVLPPEILVFVKAMLNREQD